MISQTNYILNKRIKNQLKYMNTRSAEPTQRTKIVLRTIDELSDAQVLLQNDDAKYLDVRPIEIL